MRAAMRRREREDLALDQASVAATLAPVAGEAAAEAPNVRSAQQLALDLDGARSVVEPVPEVLGAVRGLEPLWRVERTLGPTTSTARPSSARATRSRPSRANELEERAEPARPAAGDLPAQPSRGRPPRAAARRRARRVGRGSPAHRRAARPARPLGPLSRLFGRTSATSPSGRWPTGPNRAEILNEQAWAPRAPGRRRPPRARGMVRRPWRRADRARRGQARAARPRRTGPRAPHQHIRRDPPDWVTDRLGPRPDDPTARAQWDRAAAHLDDYREAFGHLPTRATTRARATTASATPGSKRTAPPPRPSNSTPNGPPSSTRRPKSTATSASTWAYDGDDETLGEAQRYAKPLLTPGVSCCSRSPVKAQRKRSRLDAWGAYLSIAWAKSPPDPTLDLHSRDDPQHHARAQ